MEGQQSLQSDRREITAYQILENEFHLRCCRLSFPTEKIFYRTQWDWPQLAFVIYRFFIAIYITIWLIYSIVFMPKWGNHVWPTFLTNWSYCVLAIYLIYAACVAWRRNRTNLIARALPLTSYCPEDFEGRIHVESPSLPEGSVPVVSTYPSARQLPLDLKIEWTLFAIIANFAFIVTLVYFTILYPRIYGKNAWTRIHPVDLHIHGINSVVVMIELFITAMPVRLLHAIYPILYGLVYVIFSTIYWGCDPKKNVIYKGVLDWNKPGQTVGVILLLGFIVIPIFQFIVFGIYRFRIWLYNYCQRSWLA